MTTPPRRDRGVALALLLNGLGCGARTDLSEGPPDDGGGGATSASTTAASSGEGGAPPCGDGGPTTEACNGLDDDCDGEIDEGFGLGAACDGADADLCADDVVTCAGCSDGPDALESCNGQDDDCDGIVDADCEIGGCTPDLLVVDVQKSMPSCFVDAVQTGSVGSLDYPCGGGPVSSTFGDIVFTGDVSGGVATLIASTTFPWGDGCTWQSSQVISGVIASGALSYSYEEKPISGFNCQPACFANGTIQVLW